MPRKQKYKDRHYCDEDNPHTCVVEKPRPRRRKPKTASIFDLPPKKMSTHLLFKNALVIS
jgi:hypothetical protein